jgi:CelD/BcsL family acetyltransferase involved in cellulose biosynthesis
MRQQLIPSVHGGTTETPLVARLWEGWSNDAADHAAWDALQSRLEGSTLFSSFDFLNCWVDFFGYDRRILILTVGEEDGTLHGILPLQITEQQQGPLKFRRLELLRNAHISRAGAIVADDPAPVVGLMAQVLRAARSHFDDLVFERMGAEDPVQCQLVDALASEGFKVSNGSEPLVIRTVRHRGPMVTYIDELSTKMRQDSRRAMRRCEALPGFKETCIQDTAAAVNAMRELFSFDWMSAKRGKAGAVYGPDEKLFHAELVSQEGSAHKYEYIGIEVDGKPAGGIVNLIHNRVYYLLVIYTDQAYAQANVGRYLILSAIRHGLEHCDVDYIDMNGDSQIIKQVTDSTIPLMVVKASHGGIKSRMIGAVRAKRQAQLVAAE